LPASTGEPADRPARDCLPAVRVGARIDCRHSRPLQANAPAAVFADPVFSKARSALRGTAHARGAARTRGDADVYARLRFIAQRKRRRSARLLPAAFEALDFTAAKQTPERARSAQVPHSSFRDPRIAQHRAPELSGLVLSLVDKDGKPIDGFLRLHEIYKPGSRADLVVLSACRTALGKKSTARG